MPKSDAASARSGSRPELSHQARQLWQFIGWAAFPNFPFALALLGLWALFPDPVVLGLAIATFMNGLIGCIAWIEAGRERVRASVLWYAGGIWGLSFAIGLVGSQLFTIATILAALPTAVAVPYVSRRDLLLLAACTTAVVALDSVGLVYAPLAPQVLPEGMVRVVVIVGVVSLIGVLGLSLWHTRHTLDLVFDRMREANAALRESERSLEDKVRERTAELERSRRELAVARDEAVAANRHKSAFLANMSHELRTPLNAIIGFSEVLLEKIFGQLEAKQEEYLRDVHESGRHLLSLINDILDLSKIEAGRLELSPSSFMLSAAIENALVLMRERAARRGITLGVDLDPTLGEVVLDERKVKQVLINLLSNAVKFTDEGGRVTTHARVRGDRVALSVEDTGIGIPPEERELIFEEFRQGHAGAQRKVEGTGLGLALTKRLVELHGGCIRVESEVGRGSVFHVDLPLRVLGGNTQEDRGGG